MSQQRRERFVRARTLATVLDPAQIEADAYNAAIDLAMQGDWHRQDYPTGKEIVRHASRMALAQHVAPELWAYCRSCYGAGTCKACNGTRSVLISEGELAARIGIPHETFVAIWRPRIDLIAREIGKWCEA